MSRVTPITSKTNTHISTFCYDNYSLNVDHFEVLFDFYAADMSYVKNVYV